jgi:hypothetical protein
MTDCELPAKYVRHLIEQIWHRCIRYLMVVLNGEIHAKLNMDNLATGALYLNVKIQRIFRNIACIQNQEFFLLVMSLVRVDIKNSNEQLN